MQNQVERLEKQLADLEKEEKQLQTEVMKGGMPSGQLEKGYEKLGDLAKRIAVVMLEWETASGQLELPTRGARFRPKSPVTFFVLLHWVL